MFNVDNCVPKIKAVPNGEDIQKEANGAPRRKQVKESPKGPSQGTEAMLRAKNRIPGLAPGSNGAGSLRLFSPNGHGADQKAPQEPESQEAIQDPKAFGVVQEWKIGDLKPHPKQDDYFPDESEEADAELEADMKVKGQRDPIYILRDGTIISGHRRVKMAKRLGWKTIKVIVHDLDDEEGEALFIDNNYMGRQLSDFQKVRCAARKIELAKRGKAVLPAEVNAEKKTRDKIGKLLGYSGRHVDRYLLALKAPPEVQHACDKGYLKLAEVGQVAQLDKKGQQAIAAEIREKGLAEAKAIFKRHFPDKAETQPSAEDTWRGLYGAMRKATPELLGRVDQVGRLNPWDLEAIEKIEPLLTALKAKAVADINAAEEDARWDPEEHAHEDNITGVSDGESVDMMSTKEER